MFFYREEMFTPGARFFEGTFIHPNPVFYKYYWSIFWKDKHLNGHREQPMPMKQAFDFIAKLESEQLPYVLSNLQRPRRDPKNTPFDLNSKRWHDTEWALPFDEDPDEPYKIFRDHRFPWIRPFKWDTDEIYRAFK